MLFVTAPISIGYGVGSLAGQMQQNAFELLESNGHGDNPNLYNVTW